MIDKLTYEQVLDISKKLKEETSKVEEIVSKYGITGLEDFIATVEGYSKFLENSIEINKDADNALKGLKDHLK